MYFFTYHYTKRDQTPLIEYTKAHLLPSPLERLQRANTLVIIFQKKGKAKRKGSFFFFLP
jgi:hypothetical protein